LKSNKLKPKNDTEPAKKARPQAEFSKKKTKKSTGAKKVSKKQINPGLKISIGLFLILASFYLILSFSVFLINWFDSNPSVISHTLGLEHYFADHAEIVRNWTGRFGIYLSTIFVKRGIGLGAYFISLILFDAGLRFLTKIKILTYRTMFQLLLLGFLWLPMTMSLLFSQHPDNIFGGLVGHQLNLWTDNLIGTAGLIFLLVFVPAIFILIRFNFFRKNKFKKDKEDQAGMIEKIRGSKPKEDKYNTVEFAIEEEETEIEEHRKESVQSKNDELPKDITPITTATGKAELEFTIEKPKEEAKAKVQIKPGVHIGLDTEFDPRLDLPDFMFPGLELLNDYNSGTFHIDNEELSANKQKIVKTLKDYSIEITKIKATIGPTITLYEIVPAPGVRIAKIRNLEDDIALSLSAMGIRIIAPIPGKGTIGIEVPNRNPAIVSMKSILESERFQNSGMELPLGLGKTISNESYVVDLTKMPHILMAGATGQGKSVGLNAIIASLLYKKHPSELKFVMVDPKKVELTLFSRIERHYLAKLPDSEEAIITDTRKVVRTLNSLGIEMDNRYELLKDAQVRNIKEYNHKFKARKLNPNLGHRFLPYIVLIIDEFADLIMTAGKEIEGPITRLAQLARAVGIHLVIATQRPSVNIITGTIKANFPARIAFRVISKIDSRTILDTGGADQLVGRGDMLMATGSDLIRLQCAFIDTDEVEKVTGFIGQQRAYPDALHLPEYYDEEKDSSNEVDLSERDELFEDAALIIVKNQQGSTSLLQRKLKLGYNRAGRIIDQLEAAKIVGPFEGSKAREVRVANEMALEQFLKDLYTKTNKNNNAEF